MRKLLQQNKVWFVLVILLLPSLFGLFHPGFFVSDDGNWMVIRFSAFYEAFRHGQFPVRFLPRLLNGYGYPVSDFLYPLFMYIATIIHLTGISFVNTIKILFGLSILGSGIFTFLWLRRLYKSLPAMIGALSFVYFPYHLFDIYTRGSIGEMLALCITPFVLWQIERKNNVLICLGYGLLILAHNSLAIIVLPILIVYSLLRKHALKDVVVEILCGIGFSAFFWLPALFDKQYTVFDSRQIADFGKYFVNFSSIYLLGLISVVAMAGFIVGLLKKNILGIFFGLIFVISIFLAISLSTNVWHIIPLGKYIQFPFRFLSLTTLCVGFFCAFILSVLKKKMVLFLLLLVLIAYSSWSVLFPKEYQYYPDSWYSTNQASTTVQNEYLPIWVSEIPTNKLHVAQLIKGKGEVLSQTQQGSKIHITLSSKTESLLQINTIYFPGWIVMVDGRQTPIVYANTDGLMQVALNSGNHTVTAFFTETPVRIIADGVSILSIVCLGLYVFIRRKKYE